MKDLIKINEQEIVAKEWQGKRVVTFNDIDVVHKRASGTARKRFYDNKKRFLLGTDYFQISLSEIRTNNMLWLPKEVKRDIVVFTESGYLLLVKSFTDDLAWEVQRQLVNAYFQVTNQPQKSVYAEDERKKLADAKLLNAKARAANVWLKLSKESSVPTFKDICVAYGSAVMNDGTPILSLPAAPERTYSAKEIGEMVGMSANKVGLLTNKFALKTDTYGQWVWDKSEHSAKQVRTFRYNIRIVEALQELLAKGVA